MFRAMARRSPGSGGWTAGEVELGEHGGIVPDGRAKSAGKNGRRGDPNLIQLDIQIVRSVKRSA
jgi:hypothetical protein